MKSNEVDKYSRAKISDESGPDDWYLVSFVPGKYHCDARMLFDLELHALYRCTSE